ncbi:uncharacterized protein METZ01_LOCUS507893, partial [marine metagenome]
GRLQVAHLINLTTLTPPRDGSGYGKEKERLKFLPIMYADRRMRLRPGTRWALTSRPGYSSPIPPKLVA